MATSRRTDTLPRLYGSLARADLEEEAQRMAELRFDLDLAMAGESRGRIQALSIDE